MLNFKNKKLPSCEHYISTVHQLNKITPAALDGRIDITVDLEDAIGLDYSINDTQQILAAIKKLPTDIRVGIRIPTIKDIKTLSLLPYLITEVGHKLAYLTLPKINNLDELNYISLLIQQLTQAAKIRTSLPLHVLIETQEALANCHQIAAHPQVEALCFGLLDFVQDHDGRLDPSVLLSKFQFEHSLISLDKAQIVAAAMRYGKVATHNVCLHIGDEKQLSSDAFRANKYFGFSRMLSIHPSQINIIIEGFKLYDDDLNNYLSILKQAQQIRWKPIKHNGVFYDLASYRLIYKRIKRIALSDSKIFSELEC